MAVYGCPASVGNKGVIFETEVFMEKSSISKGWQWEMLKENQREYWRNPSEESYYLVNRWKMQGKEEFLDLGCGMGRHSILFGKNLFHVKCFDISEEAIQSTKLWAEAENLEFGYAVGDMLCLPYEDESFDCIMCRNVISHSDMCGVVKTVAEIRRHGDCSASSFRSGAVSGTER